MAEYLVVAWLIHGGLAGRLAGWRRAIAAAVIASLLGVHDELAQGLHPERTFGWPDLVTNALGAAAGGLSAQAIARFRDAGAPGGVRHAALFAALLCLTLLIYPALGAVFDREFR